jgi:hypothetical protein
MGVIPPRERVGAVADMEREYIRLGSYATG